MKNKFSKFSIFLLTVSPLLLFSSFFYQNTVKTNIEEVSASSIQVGDNSSSYPCYLYNESSPLESSEFSPPYTEGDEGGNFFKGNCLPLPKEESRIRVEINHREKQVVHSEGHWAEAGKIDLNPFEFKTQSSSPLIDGWILSRDVFADIYFEKDMAGKTIHVIAKVCKVAEDGSLDCGCEDSSSCSGKGLWTLQSFVLPKDDDSTNNCSNPVGEISDVVSKSCSNGGTGSEVYVCAGEDTGWVLGSSTCQYSGISEGTTSTTTNTGTTGSDTTSGTTNTGDTSSNTTTSTDTGSTSFGTDTRTTASGWPSNTNENLPMAGIFYGNPTGGVHAANANIAEISSRRFRAQKTGDVVGVMYNNRMLNDYNMTSRCEYYGETSGSNGQWCDCVNAGLDTVACSYTLGSSYAVGSGGLITIELRPDDGNGFPSETILGKTYPFVPVDTKPNGYPYLKFTTPTKTKAGQLYHLVYTNSRLPIKCPLSHVDPSKAKNCERDRGAIGLNGVFYPHNSTTTGAKGPWYGTQSAANLFKKSQSSSTWSVYTQNLSFFELTYSDGVKVGDTYNAWSATIGDTERDIEGNKRVRQVFTVLDASRRVDGLWLNFGHSPTSNGSSLTVTLKNSSGSTLATGSISPSATCRATSKGSSWNRHCRDWGYTSFNKTVTLSKGSKYSVEFNAPSGAGFEVSTLEALSEFSFGFDDLNNWESARGEVSTNNGASWGDWTIRVKQERDMTLLFTIEGMPRQMP